MATNGGGNALRWISWLIAALLIVAALSDLAWLGGDPGVGALEALVLVLATMLAARALLLRSWNAAVLTGVVSTALTLCLAKLVARPLFGARYRTPFRLDARRLYTPVPSADREYRRLPELGGDRIVYSFNADGFRGEPLARPRSALRVAVYGDSFIQAEYSSVENSFAEQLERDLASALGVPIEAVNAGVAGYGPDQSLRRMEEELGWLEPDLVVVAIYAGNDFGDLVRNNLYRLGLDGALTDNAFVLDDELLLRMDLARKEPVLRRALREGMRALGGPALPPAIPGEQKIERNLAQAVAEYQEFVERGDDVIHELLSDPYNADVTLLPDSDPRATRFA